MSTTEADRIYRFIFEHAEVSGEEIARQLSRVEREDRFAANRYEKFRRMGL